MRELITKELEEPKEDGMYVITEHNNHMSVVTYHIKSYWYVSSGDIFYWDEFIKRYSKYSLYIEKLHLEYVAPTKKTPKKKENEPYVHLKLKQAEKNVFAKAMFDTLAKYGLFPDDYEAYETAFVNNENGQFGFDAIEDGIDAVNNLRKSRIEKGEYQ